MYGHIWPYALALALLSGITPAHSSTQTLDINAEIEALDIPVSIFTSDQSQLNETSAVWISDRDSTSVLLHPSLKTETDDQSSTSQVSYWLNFNLRNVIDKPITRLLVFEPNRYGSQNWLGQVSTLREVRAKNIDISGPTASRRAVLIRATLSPRSVAQISLAISGTQPVYASIWQDTAWHNQQAIIAAMVGTLTGIALAICAGLVWLRSRNHDPHLNSLTALGVVLAAGFATTTLPDAGTYHAIGAVFDGLNVREIVLAIAIIAATLVLLAERDTFSKLSTYLKGTYMLICFIFGMFGILTYFEQPDATIAARMALISVAIASFGGCLVYMVELCRDNNLRSAAKIGTPWLLAAFGYMLNTDLLPVLPAALAYSTETILLVVFAVYSSRYITASSEHEPELIASTATVQQPAPSTQSDPVTHKPGHGAHDPISGIENEWLMRSMRIGFWHDDGRVVTLSASLKNMLGIAAGDTTIGHNKWKNLFRADDWARYLKILRSDALDNSTSQSHEARLSVRLRAAHNETRTFELIATTKILPLDKASPSDANANKISSPQVTSGIARDVTVYAEPTTIITDESQEASSTLCSLPRWLGLSPQRPPASAIAILETALGSRDILKHTDEGGYAIWVIWLWVSNYHAIVKNNSPQQVGEFQQDLLEQISSTCPEGGETMLLRDGHFAVVAQWFDSDVTEAVSNLEAQHSKNKTKKKISDLCPIIHVTSYNLDGWIGSAADWIDWANRASIARARCGSQRNTEKPSPDQKPESNPPQSKPKGSEHQKEVAPKSTSSDGAIELKGSEHQKEAAPKSTSGDGAIELNSDVVPLRNDKRWWSEEFREGLANNEIEMHFSPIHRFSDNLAIGMRGHICWNHHLYGAIHSDAIAELARITQLRSQLTQHIFQTARHQQRPPRSGGEVGKMFVTIVCLPAGLILNCNPREFGALATSSTYDQMVLSVSQNAFFQHPKRFAEQLHLWREYGMGLCLTDATSEGTRAIANSDLTPEIVELATELRNDALGGERGRIVPASIIDTYSQLGARHFIAPGIDSKRLAQIYAAIGIDAGYGPMFHPLPVTRYRSVSQKNSTPVKAKVIPALLSQKRDSAIANDASKSIKLTQTHGEEKAVDPGETREFGGAELWDPISITASTTTSDVLDETKMMLGRVREKMQRT